MGLNEDDPGAAAAVKPYLMASVVLGGTLAAIVIGVALLAFVLFVAERA